MMPTASLSADCRRAVDGINFTFTGSDASGVAGFECSLNAGPFAACQSPKTFGALATGQYSLPGPRDRPRRQCRSFSGGVTWTILPPGYAVLRRIDLIFGF
jgi:hypothetical protein